MIALVQGSLKQPLYCMDTLAGLAAWLSAVTDMVTLPCPASEAGSGPMFTWSRPA